MTGGGGGGWLGKADDNNKALSPLFPRLHVNDADKGGGPRPPPRNKMALYEQLSIPSQKFNPSGACASGVAAYSAAAGSASVASSSQGGSHERSVFSPYTHTAPSQLAEMVQSHSSNPKNFKSTRMELMKRSLGHANHKSSGALGSTAECNSFRPHDFSSMKSSCDEKFDDEDDFMVPTFAHSDTAHSSKSKFVMERPRSTLLHTNSPEKSCSATLNTSIQFPSSYDKPLEQVSADPKSGKRERNYSGHKSKETLLIKEHREKSVFHLKTREEPAVNCSKACSDQEQTSRIDVIEKQLEKNTKACIVSSNAMSEPECLNAIHNTENEDVLRVRYESCIKASFGSKHRDSDMVDDYNRGSDEMVSGSVERKDADKNDEVSETSMVDSISGLEISPDDVVGVIGPKQFWKARRAIVNQQRVFAVQVFELHRLIKVQKLIAASPYLLHEENPYLSGSPQKVPDENLPPESGRISQPEMAKQEDDSPKLKKNTECQTENTLVPPLPSHDDELNKGLRQLPRYPAYSGNPPPPVSVAPETKPPSWCYPHANHWLVPVMSPSEGLIYKPYPGPCPPAAGFIPPVYGNCGPLNMPPANGDFINTTYNVPASHQQQNMPVFSSPPAISPNYFPSPYGLPVVNPNISVSAVEQVNPTMGSRPSMQSEQRSRSSCNMGIPRSEAFSGSCWKAPTSKDSELQGSTASSPFERGHTGRSALPLFPTVPATEGSAHPSQSHDGDHRTRVIKVVPHNARSATESAARIFRSIQEERQQYES